MKMLHPGARWLFRLGFYFIGVILTAFLIIISFSVSKELFFLGIIIFVFMVGIGEIYTRLAYNRWFYEFTDNQLRLERGIIWKRYSNIPYERVQNVDITRGIIARLCGFSTVMIQTAGFSYSPHPTGWTEGYIPAVSVEEAEHIREFLIKKISNKGRKQGL